MWEAGAASRCTVWQERNDERCVYSNTIYYKPNNGMLESFIKHYDINREKSFLIGDRWKDIVPGKNSGLTTILVGDTEYTPPEEYKHITPDYKVENIWEAYCLIMEIDNARF